MILDWREEVIKRLAEYVGHKLDARTIISNVAQETGAPFSMVEQVWEDMQDNPGPDPDYYPPKPVEKACYGVLTDSKIAVANQYGTQIFLYN
jgi:hypothetical protein